MFEAELVHKDGKIKQVHARSMQGLIRRIEKEKPQLASYMIKRIRVDEMKQGRGIEYVE